MGRTFCTYVRTYVRKYYDVTANIREVGEEGFGSFIFCKRHFSLDMKLDHHQIFLLVLTKSPYMQVSGETGIIELRIICAGRRKIIF